jgi:hypothetical protein
LPFDSLTPLLPSLNTVGLFSKIFTGQHLIIEKILQKEIKPVLNSRTNKKAFASLTNKGFST